MEKFIGEKMEHIVGYLMNYGDADYIKSVCKNADNFISNPSKCVGLPIRHGKALYGVNLSNESSSYCISKNRITFFYDGTDSEGEFSYSFTVECTDDSFIFNMDDDVLGEIVSYNPDSKKACMFTDFANIITNKDYSGIDQILIKNLDEEGDDEEC